MQAPSRSSAFAVANSRQRGQALIFGLFVLISGVAALFFFFNVGQLAREKTKLVNTADAVAFSAGLVHARALNFNAYSNRALIFNEVTIAQFVSLSSWALYVESWATNLPQVHYECVQAANGNYWAAAASQVKYGPDYLVGCAALYWADQYGVVELMVNSIDTVVPSAVQAIEINKSALQAAQAVINASLVEDRGRVMNEVAAANYLGDGVVVVDSWMSATTLPDDWVRQRNDNGGGAPFVSRYSDLERARFKEVTVASADRDPFIPERRWTSKALVPEPSCLPVNWRHNEVRRRGGTVLLGFDEWQAVDTQSWHSNVRGKRPWNCDRRETSTGVGGEQAYFLDQEPGVTTFGHSRTDNPSAHGEAVSQASGNGLGYRGLPTYFDLSQTWLRERPAAEPNLKHGVRLTRDRNQLRTTDGITGQIRTPANARLVAYNSTVAGGEMVAASTSEVFFERPVTEADNIFGSRSARPRELGSLFNPFWRVRLAPTAAEGEWPFQGVTP